jgi:hypothetical protein
MKYLLLLIYSILLISCVSADIISVNSGGSDNMIINPSYDLENGLFNLENPIVATCSDGIQNQGEVGVDCGGPCTACTIPPSGTTGEAGGSGSTGWISSNATQNGTSIESNIVTTGGIVAKNISRSISSFIKDNKLMPYIYIFLFVLLVFLVLYILYRLLK